MKTTQDLQLLIGSIIDSLAPQGFNFKIDIQPTIFPFYLGFIEYQSITLHVHFYVDQIILSYATLSHEVGYEDIEVLNLMHHQTEWASHIKRSFDSLIAQINAEQAYLEQEALNDAQWLKEKLGNEIIEQN